MFKNLLKKHYFWRVIKRVALVKKLTVNSADDSLFVYIIFGACLECSKIGNKRNLLPSKNLTNVFDKV